MNNMHLAVLFAILASALALENTQKNETVIPTETQDLRNKFNRNWPPSRARAHGPEVFRRMRPVDQDHENHGHFHVRPEVVAATAAPLVEKAVVEQQVQQEAPVQQQVDVSMPTKLGGGHHHGDRFRSHFHENVPQTVHFSSGAAVTTTNEKVVAQLPEKVESNTRTRHNENLINKSQKTVAISQPEVVEAERPILRNRLDIHRQHRFAEVEQQEPIFPHWERERLHEYETGNMDDVVYPHMLPFHRGHFLDRFPGHGPMDMPLNKPNRENIIRVVNRPSDIIIRNTFQDRPRSFVDLRISIDENGVLNVEAGPEGVVKSSNSNSTSPNAHVEDHLQNEDLEDHWMRNRPVRNSALHPVSSKRIHTGHEEESNRAQSVIVGTSHPPVIPKEVVKQAPKEVKQQNHAEASVVQEASKMTNQEETTAEPIKPVINIDDSSASGCPSLKCPKQCPGDLTKLDLNSGCPTCDCCPDISCRVTCPTGYESDQFGCPICRCIASP